MLQTLHLIKLILSSFKLQISPFNGKGYGGWRRSILISLLAKNKFGFIDDSHKKPASYSFDFKLWSRCNDMVLSWLLNSLSKEIADDVIYSKTAIDLWKELEDRFVQSNINGAKIYRLQKELSDLVQGSNNIAGYFTKLKGMWDEMDALNTSVNCSCLCECGGEMKMSKSLQDERLIQFLMVLNDTYAPAKSNILMLSPLTSVNHACALLMRDDQQREIFMNFHLPGNVSSFLANNYTLTQRSRCYESKGKKNTLIYSHCKKLGYSVDKLYRIIGFSSDFKFTKTKKFQANVRSNVAFTESGHEQDAGNFEGENHGQKFTQNQYSGLLQLLQYAKKNQADSSSNEAVANAATCVGPFNEEATGIW